MQKIFIISGEKSGDLIAKNIISQIQKQYPSIQIKGVGEESFIQNNIQPLFEQKEIAIMGFLEVLPQLKHIFQLLKLTQKEIYTFKPEHLITIDSPGFNFQIAKKIQHARLSKKEIRNAFIQHKATPKKKHPLKIVMYMRKIYNKIVFHASRFVKKYKFVEEISHYITFLFKKIGKVLCLINNKYTKKILKLGVKFLYFFTQNNIVQGVLLILFNKIIGIVLIIKALIIYFSTYHYLRYPLLVINKIYQKITNQKEAEKDLSTYHKILILKKLEAKNNLYCKGINIVANIPKFLQFKLIVKYKNYLENLHKKFKKTAYDKAFNCKIHHIVAPSVWAYKKNRAKKVAKLYDTLFCILPFEPHYFTPFGLKAVFIGYPPYFRMQKILQCSNGSSVSSLCNHHLQMYNLTPDQISISITLGSRFSELKYHIPAIKHTLTILNEKFPQKLQFFIISLPHLKDVILKNFQEFKNITLIDNEQEKWKVVANSRFVIGKSGTNIMEFALLGVPSIVYYKANFVTACIIKLLIYSKVGTLLNFTAGKFILPEFIQEDVKNIHIKAIEWIVSDEEINKVKQNMQKELEKFSSHDKTEETVLQNLCT